MIKALKSYRAFTNPMYRLVIWVLLPGMFLLVNGVADTLGIIGEVDIIWLGLLMLFYTVDTTADYWFMGGFYAKNNSSLEFMQSSPCFQKYMQSVVIMDMIRRLLLYIGIPLIAAGIGLSKGYSVEWYLLFSFLPLLEVLIAQIAILVGRHFVMWNHMYLCTLIGSFVILIFMAGAAFANFQYPLLVNSILAVLVLAMDVVTVWYTGKKVRDSYYDV